MAGVWDFILIWAGFMVLLAVGGFVWAMDLNNRAKLMRLTTKRNYGIITVVGKAVQTERRIVDFSLEYVILHKRVFKLVTRDMNGNPLYIYVNGVPWMFFNEDKVFPALPISERGKAHFYCAKDKKFIEDKEVKYNAEGDAICPTCSEILKEKKEILPVSIHKSGATSSLHNIWTLFEEDARLEAQGMLYNKLNEFGWIKWGILGLVLIGIVSLGILWIIYGDVHAIREHLMPTIVQAAQNMTNSTGR